MYLQKAIRMVVFPNKNTRAYFRQKRMEKMQETSKNTIGLK